MLLWAFRLSDIWLFPPSPCQCHLRMSAFTVFPKLTGKVWEWGRAVCVYVSPFVSSFSLINPAKSVWLDLVWG